MAVISHMCVIVWDTCAIHLNKYDDDDDKEKVSECLHALTYVLSSSCVAQVRQGETG